MIYNSTEENIEKIYLATTYYFKLKDNIIKVLRNDEVLIYNDSLKLTFDNQVTNDLITIINSFEAYIPYAKYTADEFDKYLRSIKY